MARQRTQVAFLLSQLGTVAAEEFGRRIAGVDLTRPEAGLLRLIGRRPGQSQRELANQLGTPPSRLVALLDGLTEKELVERRRSEADRRNYELYLTTQGHELLGTLGHVAEEHEAAVTAPLTVAERRELEKLLRRLADAHGLAEGIHPGYRGLPS